MKSKKSEISNFRLDIFYIIVGPYKSHFFYLACFCHQLYITGCSWAIVFIEFTSFQDA
jgi:hypothetical protein